jgi:DNA excision repair protein ERCC-2
MRRKFNIKDGDFITFDAIRSASQCLGRVLRSKKDWGIMILADQRFSNESKRSKLPLWIQRFLTLENLNLSIDESVAKMRTFLREIAQPEDLDGKRGDTLREDEAQAWEEHRQEEDRKRSQQENRDTWQ